MVIGVHGLAPGVVVLVGMELLLKKGNVIVLVHGMEGEIALALELTPLVAKIGIVRKKGQERRKYLRKGAREEVRKEIGEEVKNI